MVCFPPGCSCNVRNSPGNSPAVSIAIKCVGNKRTCRSGHKHCNGCNFKIYTITAFQAGLLKNWKEKLTRFLEIRRESAAEWAKLKSLNIIARQVVKNGTPYNFVRFPVRIANRRLWNYLYRVSEKECLGIMHTYPESIDRIKALRHEFVGQEYLESRKISRQLLTLPVHSLLSKRDRLKIQSTLDSIAKAY